MQNLKKKNIKTNKQTNTPGIFKYGFSFRNKKSMIIKICCKKEKVIKAKIKNTKTPPPSPKKKKKERMHLVFQRLN